MEYQCKLVPIDKLLVSSIGTVSPLCSTCVCIDCTNPIRKIKISEFGLNKEHKLYVAAFMQYMAVMDCSGYIRNEDEEK